MKRKVNFYFHDPCGSAASVCAVELLLAIKGVKARGFTGDGPAGLAMDWAMREKWKETGSFIGACDMVVIGDESPDGREKEAVIAEAHKYDVPVFWVQKADTALGDPRFASCVGYCRSLLNEEDPARTA